MVRVEVSDGDVTVATVDIAGAPPYLFVVDVVARVAAAARRRGWSASVRDPGAELAEVLGLCGLRGELGRDPERREQPFGIEEVVQPDEPPA
ncbi:MAG TPA: hypothetical protein VNA20_03765 [Frankiaceae bacterium]|nr:hypothetical protein [Frankiaceae bacterium]